LKKIVISCLLLLMLTLTAYCGEQSRIQLTDGSVINGEIISYLNGVYTIQTVGLGKIKVAATKVSKIETSLSSSSISSDSASQIGNLSPSQVDSYRQTIMSNPDNAAVITGLASDPQIQELVQDPEIIAAAKSGDVQALMKNQKFLNIINNPKMQEAVKKLKQ